MTEPKTDRDEIQTDGHDQKLRGSQLSISQLMAITVGASVVCAVLASVLHRLPKEQQAKGSLFILLMMFVCLSVLVLFYTLRARVEKRAGPRHFITMTPLSSWFHVFGILSCVLTLGVMVVGLCNVAGTEGMSDVFLIWHFGYFIWMVGAYASNYLINAFLWKTDPKSVDVRQNGIILGRFQFVPWSSLRGFRWNQYTQDLMMLMDGRFAEWKVPVSQRAQLEAELEKFIPKKAGFS